MTEYDAYRQDRIERLLHELRHEIEKGVLNREIPESMTFRFIVPISVRGPGWVVGCKFELRGVERKMMDFNEEDSGRLRVIEGGKK